MIKLIAVWMIISQLACNNEDVSNTRTQDNPISQTDSESPSDEDPALYGWGWPWSRRPGTKQDVRRDETAAPQPPAPPAAGGDPGPSATKDPAPSATADFDPNNAGIWDIGPNGELIPRYPGNGGSSPKLTRPSDVKPEQKVTLESGSGNLYSGEVHKNADGKIVLVGRDGYENGPHMTLNTPALKTNGAHEHGTMTPPVKPHQPIITREIEGKYRPPEGMYNSSEGGKIATGNSRPGDFKMEEGKRYIYTIDAEGSVLVADPKAPGYHYTDGNRREVKHRDTVANSDGTAGDAIAAGEFVYRNGKIEYDLASSYSFVDNNHRKPEVISYAGRKLSENFADPVKITPVPDINRPKK